MSSFSQVYDIHNLRRAYRWILSAQDARYKAYFRSDYAAYALSSETNLKLVSRLIRNGSFSPSHASKVYLPKGSGVLRPISLLTVNDQIAYQACLNVVATELQRKISRRHNRSVFHHIYAGPSSAFFYRRWETSYKAYADAIRSSFRDGLRFVATFDLTAFYDSIDHQVLRHLLRKSGVDQDTSAFLLRCLKHWTESTWSAGDKGLIFHEHGIPQGPLSSGMLSEVVLQYLDKIGDGRSKDFRYLRYVDDIKLMARDEKTLRRKLVALDVAAKQVGLFPQGTKIAIREVSDPEEEINSVSNPAEPATKPGAKQLDVQTRVKQLANRGNPKDSTRFKYVLPSLKPSVKTNKVLLTVMMTRPDLVDSVARHFSKYARLPNSISEPVSRAVIEEGVYHSANAEMLNLLFDRVSGSLSLTMADYCYERLFANKYRRQPYALPQPTFRASLFRWALRSARMTYLDAHSFIAGERDWWVLQDAITALDDVRLGNPSYQALLNLALRRTEPDPSRVAAASLFAKTLTVLAPHNTCTWAARVLLRFAGMIPYAGRPPSLIPSVLAYTVKFNHTYNWQKLFGSSHGAAERFMILAKQRYETDIDAFVVSLDSFCDLVLRHVFEKRGHSWGKLKYGHVVGAGAPSWLVADFPLLKSAFYKLHQLRIRSFTAHPKYASGSLNKRITHRQYFMIRKQIVAALRELGTKLPL